MTKSWTVAVAARPALRADLVEGMEETLLVDPFRVEGRPVW
jgi:hypothetical protein